jgi:exonuclease III
LFHPIEHDHAGATYLAKRKAEIGVLGLTGSQNGTDSGRAVVLAFESAGIFRVYFRAQSEIQFEREAHL